MASVFDRLTIPTHPDYDLERDSGSIDYVPPAVLNNYVVLYLNAAVELTKSIVVKNQEIERLRLERNEKERFVDGIRMALLANNPIPASATKNLQLTDAHVHSLAAQSGQLQLLQQAKTDVAQMDDQIATAKSAVESMRFTMETIKLAMTGMQTHLAFIKMEAKLSR